MTQPVRLLLATLIGLIDEPNQLGWGRLFAENHKLFKETWGSVHNHQAWPGGFLDHIVDMTNFGVSYHKFLSSIRPLDCTVSDVVEGCLGHDIEKPWKYEVDNDGVRHHRPGMETKADHQAFRMGKLMEYDIVVSPLVVNAIKYAEGELEGYSNRERVSSPLAALVHVADHTSARIFHEYPLATGDPWKGAWRCNPLAI